MISFLNIQTGSEPKAVVPGSGPDDDHNDATIRRSVGGPIAAEADCQTCLVQIYPPDVVDGMFLIEDECIKIGRGDDTDLMLADASVSRHHCEIVRRPDGFMARDLGSTNGTLVNGEKVTERVLGSGDTIRIGSFLFKYLSAGSVESVYHETVYGALTRDQLTGTMNKRYLLESMQREVARSVRQSLSMSIVMLDIDHFKSVNDTYGHLAGDDVLREFGQRVGEAIRADDMLARYGGEEFCLLLSATDRDEAFRLAERCREAIADAPFETCAGPLEITASFGLMTFASETIVTTSDLIKLADERLYEAKRGGRNRVCG